MMAKTLDLNIYRERLENQRTFLRQIIQLHDEYEGILPNEINGTKYWFLSIFKDSIKTALFALESLIRLID